MNKIGIIGGGFSGLMVAYHLIINSKSQITIHIIDDNFKNGKGIAYSCNSSELILNVTAGKMSAINSDPDHFLNWASKHADYINTEKKILSNAYLPRNFYGKYLESIWHEINTIAINNKIIIDVLKKNAVDIDKVNNDFKVTFSDGNTETYSSCILSTGNQPPQNPTVFNQEILQSNIYYQNPWDEKIYNKINNKLPILIIGNGLSMVDTVIELKNIGFNNKIFSLSPHGYNILPHRTNDVTYEDIKIEYKILNNISLLNVLKLINFHRKKLRSLGVSAEAVIDAIRPFSQEIWRKFTINEKRIFLNRLRHFWGVARHRLPMQIHDKIQNYRIKNELEIIAGKIIDANVINDEIKVLYTNRITNENSELIIGKIINCTGPEMNYSKCDNKLLLNCIRKGYIQQEDLNLGINIDVTSFQVKGHNNQIVKNLFTLGSSLRGELWESTSVTDIKIQAESVANIILKNNTIHYPLSNQ